MDSFTVAPDAGNMTPLSHPRFHRRARLAAGAASILAALAISNSWAAESGQTETSSGESALAQLACDPLVRAALNLRGTQVTAIDDAYATIEEPLWLLRDAATGPSAERKRQLLASFVTKLDKVLDPQQQTRLRQLAFQAQGWPALVSREVSAQLALSTKQTHRIDEIVTRTRDEIRKVASSADEPPARETALKRLRSEEGAAIQGLLGSAQRQALTELVGPAYDLSAVRPLSFRAPELKQVDAWINSKPLEFSALGGKVVAFHFWAFNCINCVHNLPHYDAWHRRYADRGLVVVGMHTPETSRRGHSWKK
jgi:hypothetical protein